MGITISFSSSLASCFKLVVAILRTKLFDHSLLAEMLFAFASYSFASSPRSNSTKQSAIMIFFCEDEVRQNILWHEHPGPPASTRHGTSRRYLCASFHMLAKARDRGPSLIEHHGVSACTSNSIMD